ncbi:MAG: histidine kinase, partial [Bacteroidetes bacterium]|nr:histidine kinase [Bacteroidota bacterium]
MICPSNKLLLLFLLPAFIHCQGQSYYFRHYQVEDGLAHNTVITIMQDSKGMMWLGTKGGLNRFDGYTFRTYRDGDKPSGSIGNNIIVSIAEDRNSMIWIGTGRGLFKYNSYTEQFSEPNIDQSMNISHILVDEENNLWFLGNGQLFCYNQQKKTAKAIGLYGNCLSFDKNMNLWIGNDDGIALIYNPPSNLAEKIQIVTGNMPKHLKHISKIFLTDGDLMLIGTTKQGLKSYNTHTGEIQSLLLRNSDSTEIYVRDIAKAGPDEYWIATESGIYIYNTRTHSSRNLRKRTGDAYSITDNAIYSLCCDRQGGVWAGSFFGGVNYFSAENARFEKYYPLQNTNSISGNAVREICGDDEHNIWIGTEDAGVNKFEPVSGRFTQYTT